MGFLIIEFAVLGPVEQFLECHLHKVFFTSKEVNKKFSSCKSPILSCHQFQRGQDWSKVWGVVFEILNVNG